MRNYFTCFFHIIIISTIFIFLGCGYKAPPVWEENNQSKKIKPNDLEIIKIDNVKVKIGEK